jgi:hypothetical protein
MRKSYLALLLMFLLGLPVWAGTVIGVDTLDPNSIGGYTVDSVDALAIAWTQTVGITGSVRVNFQGGSIDPSGTFYAYLTGAIGSGASVANEIASTTFSSPGLLDGPVWIDLFDQIDLGPGFYYLTIGSLDATSGGWSDTMFPVVTEAPGFFRGDGIGSQFWASYGDLASYLPASNFSYISTVVDGGGPDLMFDVFTPEPATIWLMGGALWLALLRRKRSA